MPDTSLLGPWVRRFLMEHVVSERNLARNTQRSYRDALRLLLPTVARRARKPVDRLTVLDLSPEHRHEVQSICAGTYDGCSFSGREAETSNVGSPA